MIFGDFFFERKSITFNFLQTLTRIKGDLHEDWCSFVIAPRWTLLRIRNISNDICRENQNTFPKKKKFSPENLPLFFPDSVEKYGTDRQAKDGSIIRRIRVVSWIAKATNTHSEYCNNYCFSTTTMVARTLLTFTLHVLWICCFFRVSRERLIFWRRTFFSNFSTPCI